MNNSLPTGKRRAVLNGTLALAIVMFPCSLRAEPAGLASEDASSEVRSVAAWIVASRDNRRQPFVIVDKVNTKVFLFDRDSRLRAVTPALLGIGKGDTSAPGIGTRRLAAIGPADRTTPAGRFEASLGHDLEQDILWVDYATALSLHRVITGNPKDRRAARLASPTASDNRISYGCINVPAAFYDDFIVPAFKGTVGIVYILPEVRAVGDVFAIGQVRQ
jgi:hypothetical protein